MRGSDIIRQIDQQPQADQAFIRWWRRENDFADYELIDSFRERVEANQEFGGYELLDIEGMWNELVRLSPDRVERHKRTQQGEVIIWKHRDIEGNLHEWTYPFNAQSLMTVFDKVTRGDTIV